MQKKTAGARRIPQREMRCCSAKEIIQRLRQQCQVYVYRCRQVPSKKIGRGGECQRVTPHDVGAASIASVFFLRYTRSSLGSKPPLPQYAHSSVSRI